MRVGPRVGRPTRRRARRPAALRRTRRRRRPRARRGEPAAPGRGQAGRQAADQDPRAADEVVGVDYVDPATAPTSWSSSTSPRRTGSTSARWSVELARSLDTRIDLRQIGSRDAARLIGGLGNCGRDLCCATFLKDFEPVSLRMAKVQDLPPNPMKISGACGRLMCCLKYEHPLYAEFAREVPAVGAAVEVDGEAGVVVAHQVPADSVLVRMKASGAVSQCSRASVCGSRQAYEDRAGAGAAPPRTPSAGRTRPRDARPAPRPADARWPACAVAAAVLARGCGVAARGPSRPRRRTPAARPSSARRPRCSRVAPTPPDGRPLRPVPDVVPPGFTDPPAGLGPRPLHRAAARLAAVPRGSSARRCRRRWTGAPGRPRPHPGGGRVRATASPRLGQPLRQPGRPGRLRAGPARRLPDRAGSSTTTSSAGTPAASAARRRSAAPATPRWTGSSRSTGRPTTPPRRRP